MILSTTPSLAGHRGRWREPRNPETDAQHAYVREWQERP